MKKIIFGVFAHPDDEAFGPAGTLLSETKHGADLRLITLTAGENGMNPDHHDNLHEVRLEEWRTAGALMGASRMYHLGFTDGMLGNIAMLEAVERVETLVRAAAAAEPDAVIEIMSMDLSGISGHIDHIVASRAAHHVFYKLKDAGLPLARLRLACTPREHTGQTPNYDFVFMEPGRLPGEITETIDNRAHLQEILAIMRAHHTQRSDGELHIKKLGDTVAINHFIVKE